MRLSLAVAMAGSCAGVALAPCAPMLFAAAASGSLALVEDLLAQGCDTDSRDANGNAAACAAAVYGHVDVLGALLRAGAAVNQAMDDGWTPLLIAAQEGHAGVVDLLIDNGAAVDQATNFGSTLKIAAMFCQDAFDMFLEALGCDACAVAFWGHLAVLTSLLRANCMAAIELLATVGPIALFSLVVAFLGSWALYRPRGAGARVTRADGAYLDLLMDAGSDQAVRRNGVPSQPRSTTTTRRREESKPGTVRRTMHEDADAATTTMTTSGEPRGALTQSRTLPSEPPAADDNDEAAMHVDESSQAGDAASRSVEEVKTETCDEKHTCLVEAPPPPDDFNDANTVALLESLGLGSLLAVFRKHEIDDSALLYLETGDMRDMDIPLASAALKILSAARSCHKSQQLLSAQAMLDGAAKHQAVLEAELHEHRAELARLRVALRDVDEDLKCPITFELMKDPVILRDGNTYERVFIEQWFETGALTSPLTNEALSSLDLVPNIFARKIAESLDKCRRAPGF
ncbi:hypothetical protein M885DRAFT_505712 [Pelagophyceae sp. CCMP2097]|nr:hypothetical protein M885DRAFT_505712 [Pelagophyceae sp. CCMP2097]